MRKFMSKSFDFIRRFSLLSFWLNTPLVKNIWNRICYQCEEKYNFILAFFFILLTIVVVYFLLFAFSNELLLKDIILGCCIIGSLLFVIIKPYRGIIVFLIVSWLVTYVEYELPMVGMIHLKGFELSGIVTLFTLLGWLLMIVKSQEFKFTFAKQNNIIIGLWVMMVISTIFASDKSRAWEFLKENSKVFFFYFAIVNLINSRRYFKHIVWTVLFIFGYFSIYGELLYFSKGLTYIGGPGWGDNNLLALFLVMALPFAFYLFFAESSFLKRSILIILFLTIIGTIIVTFSRGGFVGLIAILIVIFLKMKKKFLVFYIGISILLVCLVFLPYGYKKLLPEGYKERIKTILTYQQDISAMGRVYAWEAGLKMMGHHPFVGVGLDNFQPQSHEYNSLAPINITPHNSFIQIGAECGLIALFLFILLIITSARDLEKIKKNFQRKEEGRWIIPFANMIEVSLCGYLVSGSFLNKAYIVFLYLLIALTVSLKQIATKEEKTDS